MAHSQPTQTCSFAPASLCGAPMKALTPKRCQGFLFLKSIQDWAIQNKINFPKTE
ncbi:hypothetical protein ARMA_2247 [Ardenticatena maritima]|uniref:Uncharacterized protein n=1 Tax=Ardenticatena maritima TaxID=872965 RepID=A0A0M9UDB1_9CHLR|nr:hypothetical protein ARMA_2247 [Ardenticatena maritima]